MQYDFLEHQWGIDSICEWVSEAFDSMSVWLSVDSMHRQLGVHTSKGILFMEQGDWLQSLPDGTYGVRYA
jgi:hypothetical protein